MKKDSNKPLSRWMRQRNTAEVIADEAECSEIVFTPEGRSVMREACRELPDGEDRREFICKRTFMGYTIPEKVLKECGVFFSVSNKALEIMDNDTELKGVVAQIRSEGLQDLSGKWWFAADGEMVGLSHKAMAFRLPKETDGPIAFAGWENGQAPALWCWFMDSEEEPWTYRKEDWYLPEAKIPEPLTLAEAVEEANHRLGLKGEVKTRHKPRKCPF